jgi:hypothetical protein
LEEHKENNKFNIGELVTYGFPNIQGVQAKIGIVLSLKESDLYGWTYTVKWNNGEEQTYAQQHLRHIASAG